VLAAALLVGAAAPALGPLLPAWELQVGREPVAASPPVPPLVMPTPVDAVPALAPPEAVRPARATLPLSAAITFVWIAGAMLVLAGLATGLVRLAHATRRCRPVMSGPWRVAFVPAADAGAMRSPSRIAVQPRLQPPGGAGAAQTGPLPAPVRVGGNFRFPERVTTVRPSCPPEGLSGDTVTVVLGGRIGGDGTVHDGRVLTAFGGAAPEFVEAALEAFRRWTYAPPRLNGQPVDVDVRVQVVFERAGGLPGT
jgi:hypothetical protein